MKRLVVFFLFLSVFASAQGAFERGNAYYQKGDYAAAADTYERILRGGKHSAELYYNLGNAYYKQHKVALSIYNFEKALVLAPHDKDIKGNLEFARKLAIDDVREKPKVGFEKITTDLAGLYHYESWAWIAVVTAFVFAGFFIGYYLAATPLRKRLFFSGMLASLLLLLIACFSAYFGRDVYRRDRPAIVFAEVISAKAEPKQEAPDAFVLHEGAKVRVLENLDRWRKVQLPDDTEGWIPATAIREIK
ncbi:MAG TPA: tetratricopeptide repeat protein [Flavobacterium sp.]|nr:tetratricopeptide repeat protein [Flavobacterium sp.]